MAETAANNSADALSSPGSVNGSQRPWDQSVPNGQDSANVFPSKSRTSHDSTATYSKYSQRHNTTPHAVNGTSRSRTSSRSGSMHGYLHEQGYLAPHRVDTLSRKDHSLSRNGSDAESLLDLYGRDSANRSTSSVMDSVDRKPENKPHYEAIEDPNESHWIHRDKLAKIESEELQQFGIKIRDPLLMRHRSGGGRGRSRESQSIATNGARDRSSSSPIIPERTEEQISPPAPIEDSPQEDEGGPVVFDDPRLPEEIAADPHEDGRGSKIYRMPGLRKSSSRIPVLTSSPHPIPPGYLERDSPLQRPRNNTATSGDEEGLSLPKTRRPSVSAPRMLQTPEPELESTPPKNTEAIDTSEQLQGSPSKSKQPAKPASAATSRKTSSNTETRKASGTHKKTSPSNSHGGSVSQRPSTRAGERRPGTAINRPEGDPPWLATMYKPDPRLPPEQQLIPTHAKKLQQELWEKEGRIPSAYDKNFAPLSIQNEEKTPSFSPEPEVPQEEFTLPGLASSPPPNDAAKANQTGAAGTDRTSHHTSPSAVHSRPAPTFTPSISVKPAPSPMQVDAPAKKEKGCSCCVIM
ncbi:predicted protein [Uncinocarpus reesii 1704]|uniref:TeaA receptor TeaR n=1 Tax=Uncinocarpus reesii (strain UAMH 1704) TaxID=336963 RepID=C4JZG0_UNCRE|nr:uncharacterized protein UREG_07561 [Uncinocarpus reesii 1704]EEP82696.1 predicted protein [Uncinocarpus reesii 1704]